MLIVNPITAFKNNVRVRSARQHCVVKQSADICQLALELREEISKLAYYRDKSKTIRSEKEVKWHIPEVRIKLEKTYLDGMRKHKAEAISLLKRLRDDYAVTIPESIISNAHDQQGLKSVMSWTIGLVEQNSGWRTTLAQYKAFIKK